jgi:hypothetical protein
VQSYALCRTRLKDAPNNCFGEQVLYRCQFPVDRCPSKQDFAA